MNNISLNKLSLLMAIGLFCIAATATAASSSGVPIAHMIANVPWHQQQNAMFCGDGALETVYDYFGPDIDQKAIADVARSSSSGTWTYDMVRAGQFSYMSAAQGRFFPNAAPTAGYPERPLGYAAFSHSADNIWLQELKRLSPQIYLSLSSRPTNPPEGQGITELLSAIMILKMPST